MAIKDKTLDELTRQVIDADTLYELTMIEMKIETLMNVGSIN